MMTAWSRHRPRYSALRRCAFCSGMLSAGELLILVLPVVIRALAAHDRERHSAIVAINSIHGRTHACAELLGNRRKASRARRPRPTRASRNGPSRTCLGLSRARRAALARPAPGASKPCSPRQVGHSRDASAMASPAMISRVEVRYASKHGRARPVEVAVQVGVHEDPAPAVAPGVAGAVDHDPRLGPRGPRNAGGPQSGMGIQKVAARRRACARLCSATYRISGSRTRWRQRRARRG